MPPLARPLRAARGRAGRRRPVRLCAGLAVPRRIRDACLHLSSGALPRYYRGACPETTVLSRAHRSFAQSNASAAPEKGHGSRGVTSHSRESHPTERRGRGLPARRLSGTVLAPAAAAAVPDSDLAYLRLLVGAELLAADFQAKALASGKLSAASTSFVGDGRRREGALRGARPARRGRRTAAGNAGDIDFSYPKGTSLRPASILKLAARSSR